MRSSCGDYTGGRWLALAGVVGAPGGAACRRRVRSGCAGCARGRETVERGPQVRYHRSPVAPRGLAEQSGFAIPRAVRAPELPAPVGRERQRDPYGFAKRPGEMGNRRIHADDEIELGHERCRVGVRVEPVRNVEQRRRFGKARPVFVAHVFLQRDEAHGRLEERRELRYAHRTVRVVHVRAAARPCNAHARPLACRGHDVVPLREPGGVGRKVRRLRRNAGGARAEREGQAQQRTVPVERRHRIVFADDRHRARIVAQKRQQRALNAQHDTRVGVGQQVDVADELQRVAEALFVMHEQRPARRGLRFRAFPQGGVGKAVRVGAVAPAPFVFAPAVLELAEQQVGLRAIRTGAHVVGVDSERLAKLGEGFVEAVQIAQGDAQVHVGRREVRLDGDGAPVGCHFVVVAAQRAEELAPVVMRFVELRMAHAQAIEGCQRTFVLAVLYERHREPMQQRRMIGGPRKTALEEVDRLAVPLRELAELRGPKILLVRNRSFGAALQQARGAVRGARVVALPGGNVSKTFQCLAVVGRLIDGFFQQAARLVEATSGEVPVGRVERRGDVQRHVVEIGVSPCGVRSAADRCTS
ncbi:protein of unknown function [Paraburkholderia kururiensis]